MKYEDLMNPELLYQSFKDCRKNVSWKYSIQKFSLYRFSEIYDLIEKLKNHDFSFPAYREFDICERGKVRHIKAMSLQERVLQKTLCREYLVPLLSKSLIFDNGATLKGKGVAFARKRIVKHLSDFYRKFGKNGYVLQIDFKDYFNSINHQKLFELLEKKIKDENILNLLKTLISKNGEKGLGIGSELSQILAVWFPNKIDHFCKEKLHLKFYGRYMDDTYILHESKDFLEHCFSEIKKLCEDLRIRVNEKKSKIISLKNGFVFLKVRYCFSSTGEILRLGGRESCKRERGKFWKFKQLLEEKVMTLTEIQNNYKSWRNSVKKFDCYNQICLTDKKFIKIFGGF